MDEIGRKRFRGRLRSAAVGLFPLLDACHERRLIDFKLVSEDRQHRRPFGISKCIEPNELWCLP